MLESKLVNSESHQFRHLGCLTGLCQQSTSKIFLCSCLQTVLHWVDKTTAMSFPNISTKVLRKKFPLKAVFQNPMGTFFFEMELSDYSSKQGSNTFFNKQNNTVSAHFKITPNATQSCGHFLSNYSKSCCSLSFTTESLIRINQSIHRFPKVHSPFHYHEEYQLELGSRSAFPTQYNKNDANKIHLKIIRTALLITSQDTITPSSTLLLHVLEDTDFHQLSQHITVDNYLKYSYCRNRRHARSSTFITLIFKVLRCTHEQRTKELCTTEENSRFGGFIFIPSTLLQTQVPVTTRGIQTNKNIVLCRSAAHESLE